MAFYPLHTEHEALALRILEDIVSRYGGGPGAEQRYRDDVGGAPVTSRGQVSDYMEKYLDNANLQSRCKVVFREGAAGSGMTWEGRSPTENYVHVSCSPIRLRTKGLKGACHHEIGTHMVRYCNNHLQSWHCNGSMYEKRHKMGMSAIYSAELEATEEGLAVLNGFFGMTGSSSSNSSSNGINSSGNGDGLSSNDSSSSGNGDGLVSSQQPVQSLYLCALHYYTAIQAHRMDFVDLYRHLERFVSCPVRRWNQCVRTRKGVKDQGRFGAFRRDQAYFVGAVDLLRSRRTIDFRELHCAKISLRDYRGLRGQIRMNGCIIPPFLHDMQKYGEHLDSVAEQNFVDED